MSSRVTWSLFIQPGYSPSSIFFILSQQAAQWFSPTPIKGGCHLWHIFSAYSHLAAKAHPSGGANRSGGAPYMLTSSSLPPRLAWAWT